MANLEFLSSCLPKVRIPGYNDMVYKDEGFLSFDRPESEDGLYVCLTTFLGFSRKYVEQYYETTRNRLFLHIKKTKIESPEITSSECVEKKPKRLAIGVEDGYKVDEESEAKYEEHNTLVVLPEFLEFNLAQIDNDKILTSVASILSCDAAKETEKMTWDGEVRPVTKHADNLKQLENGVKIPPSGWRCSKCDLTSNLWVNLTDGEISCGRKYFDGTGGNNHGVAHFEDTGYPLAVKLGTITPNGADVYSYDEDTMVENSNLPKHLSHLGINMMNMEKTEQTMTELELELNEKIGNEWNIIQEAGNKLKELNGPGLRGLKNMGNSCYLNSVFQVLFTITEFQKQYGDFAKCKNIFQQMLSKLECNSNEIQGKVKELTSDLTLQICRLGLAMTNPLAGITNGKDEIQGKGETIQPITPSRIKSIIGKDHAEFSSNSQQDALEFLLYFLTVLERSEHKNGNKSPGICFKFNIEQRYECQQSKQVRYTKRQDYTLPLPTPQELATNQVEVAEYLKKIEEHKSNKKVEVGEAVRYQVPFHLCLESLFQDEIIQDFWSSAIEEKSEARMRTRLSTFPPYLIMPLKKFTVGSDWVPKKLDVSVDMPDILDLTQYRGTGQQDGEKLLPDKEPPKEAPKEVKVDEETVVAISQMGFPLDRCRAAVIATGNCGPEAAVMWLMENNSETPEPVTDTNSPKEEDIDMVMSMGFTRNQAVKALKATNNNMERAVEWIFSNIDSIADEEQAPTATSGGDGKTDSSDVEDGAGIYELFAFISHMGTSTLCGHYVCHIKKDDRWVIFNDEKVAESVNPPKDLGYIYFYRRINSTV